jgi:DNA-binding CsgD family transcriptional regulator
VDFVAALLSALTPEHRTQRPGPGGSILSRREREVLGALAAGHSNKAIARELDLTQNTVKFHLRSLYDKLGVSSRVLAVAVAREKGVLGDCTLEMATSFSRHRPQRSRRSNKFLNAPAAASCSLASRNRLTAAGPAGG